MRPFNSSAECQTRRNLCKNRADSELKQQKKGEICTNECRGSKAGSHISICQTDSVPTQQNVCENRTIDEIQKKKNCNIEFNRITSTHASTLQNFFATAQLMKSAKKNCSRILHNSAECFGRSSPSHKKVFSRGGLLKTTLRVN